MPPLFPLSNVAELCRAWIQKFLFAYSHLKSTVLKNHFRSYKDNFEMLILILRKRKKEMVHDGKAANL